MTEIDFKNLFSENIALLEQDNDKILLIICKSKIQAEATLKYLKENIFSLYATVTEQTKTVGLKLKIVKTGVFAGINTGHTVESWSQLSWLTKQQLTHLTTGYKDDLAKLQHISPFYPLDSLVNLN